MYDTFAHAMLIIRKGLIACLILGLTSCTKELPPSQTFIHAKADSVAAFRLQEISRQAAEDLDQRMTIELKQRVDSMVQMRLKARHRMDTTSTTKP